MRRLFTTRILRISLPLLIVTVLATVALIRIRPAFDSAYIGGIPCPQNTHWRIISSPIPTDDGLWSLNGVAAISDRNVWAVGYYTNPGSLTLIEHWNGTAWQIVSSPNAPGISLLNSVSAISVSDIWAVGGSEPSNGGMSPTLTEHWDGQHWTIIPSPNLGLTTNILTSVAAVSSADVWAVGSATLPNPGTGTLVEHWNGTSWTIVPSANVTNAANFLTGITAISKNDLWAVGYAVQNGSGIQTLIEHWDGTSWQIVPSPNAQTTGANFLNSVSASASTNVLAVGEAYDASGASAQTLIERWNGLAWSIIPSANTSHTAYNYLLGVKSISSTDAWAVGYSTSNYYGGRAGQALTEHWNGVAWTRVPTADTSSGQDNLSAIAAVSAHDLWAVGYSKPKYLELQSLIERYRGNAVAHSCSA